MRIKSISLVCALAACSSSDFDPGAGDDPGSGSSTLAVDATISARARISNAIAASDFDTQISVRVRAGATDVTTGTVAITTGSGTVQLALDAEQRWIGSLPSYEEVFQLDVDNGVDFLHGVRVDGPEPFHFTAPTPGAAVDATMPMPIAWTTDSAADAAAIDTDEIDALAISDTGTYTLAPGSLKTDKDKARANTVWLTRSNQLAPSGAAGGSQVEVQIRNQIDVVANAAPL